MYTRRSPLVSRGALPTRVLTHQMKPLREGRERLN